MRREDRLKSYNLAATAGLCGYTTHSRIPRIRRVEHPNPVTVTHEIVDC